MHSFSLKLACLLMQAAAASTKQQTTGGKVIDRHSGKILFQTHQPLPVAVSYCRMANSDLVNGPAALASRQLSLFVNGSYHDFVLKCGNRSFKVHRCIICPQSHVLTTLCNGNWKVRCNAQCLQFLTDECLGGQSR